MYSSSPHQHPIVCFFFFFFPIYLFVPSVKFTETDNRIKECIVRPNELSVNLTGQIPFDDLRTQLYILFS